MLRSWKIPPNAVENEFKIHIREAWMGSLAGGSNRQENKSTQNFCVIDILMKI